MQTKKIIALLALAIPFGLAACTDREDRTAYNAGDGDRSSIADMDTTAYEQDNRDDMGENENSENQITQGHSENAAVGSGVGYDEDNVDANRYPASTTATTTSRQDNTKSHNMNKDDMNRDKKALKNVEMPLTDEQYQQAQNALKKLGYTVSKSPRGGPETTRAIQDFQNENDIPSTGSFDEMTLKRLGVLTEDRQPASVKTNR